MPTIDPAIIPIGELAVRSPAAARRMYQLGIDYCCAGRRSLTDACQAAGVDPATVLGAMDATEEVSVRGEQQPLEAVVRHIVEHFHARLRAAASPLRTLATRVAQVHGERTPQLTALLTVLTAFLDGIELHLTREEQILFPAILRNDRGFIPMPIRKMTSDHEEHGAVLERLRALTDRYRAPAQACASWRSLYAQLAELDQELIEHIHLENHVLFPRALGGTMGDTSPGSPMPRAATHGAGCGSCAPG